MATRYLSITASQDPFDAGSVDGFSQWGFNVLVQRAPSEESLGRGLAAVLQAAGVGTFGLDIFTSAMAKVPNGTGPYVIITSTGGLAPVRTHGSKQPNYQRPGAQVMVLAKDDADRTPRGAAAAAELKARQAMVALMEVVNQSVTPLET